jgi:D-alanine-D-alanine ligase
MLPRDVTVITGDPSLPDQSKPGQRYSAEDLDALGRMRAALATLGEYRFRFLDRHDALLTELTTRRPRLVLNLCDTGFRNQARLELHVPALLELLDVPYTGAPPACIATCYDKAVVRDAAAALGVPVPVERYVDPADPAAAVTTFPALIKPNLGDGSLGITKDAVVRDATAARDYLRWLARELPGHDALIQEYLPGPEYSIGVIGNPDGPFEILPALEVDFSALPAGLSPILSYESKSIPDSPYWTDIRFHAAQLDATIVTALRHHARALFRRLGLRDYARIDFRADARGQIKLLEVNPNPAWSWDGKLALMTGLAGRAYPELFRMILTAAEARASN